MLATKEAVKKYVILSYVIFLLLLMVVGLQITFFPNDTLFWFIKTVCSWSPTFAVLILFKKLYPGKTRLEQWKSWFSEKVSIKDLVFVIVMQIILFFISVFLTMTYKQVAFDQVVEFSMRAFLYSFINSALSGALGEEAGWRGVLQPTCVSKHGLVKGSLITGFIWGFWHTPLWFLTVPYKGIQLVEYIIFFMVTMVSASVIMEVTYEKNRNLIVPILIHFFINFIIMFSIDFNLEITVFLSLGYLILAWVMAWRSSKGK